jgi:hypothetical protein
VKMKKPLTLLPEDEETLERLAVEHGLNPDLVREMLDLSRNQFADMNRRKAEYQRAIEALIEKAVAQAEAADRG